MTGLRAFLAAVLPYVIAVIVIGAVVWLIGLIPFIGAQFKQIAQGIIIIGAIIWLLCMLAGVAPGLPRIGG